MEQDQKNDTLNQRIQFWRVTFAPVIFQLSAEQAVFKLKLFFMESISQACVETNVLSVLWLQKSHYATSNLKEGADESLMKDAKMQTKIQ